jgi:type IV secretory pathway VirB2 component (pilin)
MRFIKKNFWTMLAMAFVITLSFAGDAFAQGSFFDTTKKKLLAVFFDVKNTVFIIGGFGLVAVAFAAIFGKINWKWFAGLAAGLAILAAASMAIEYVVGSSATADSVEYDTGMGDTFGS